MHNGHGTGAMLLPTDGRDYHAHRIPGVAAAMAAPLPAACDLMPFVHSIYDQGRIEACVMYSAALLKSVQDQIDRNAWNVYDALGAYHAVGGNDREGIDARVALQYAQDTGLLVDGGTARHRIGSYAFVKQEPTCFVATLKAAAVAKQPCVVACRLPEVFGWDSSGAPTYAYHQICYLGYDDQENCIFGNSWGAAWGKGGFGRLSFAYLTANGFQGGDCYAYTCIDAIDTSLAPGGP